MALSAPGDVEWVRTAEIFLQAKLKGRNIGKAPSIGHIIDGIVLAFDDHPANYRASLKATVGLLKSCRDAHSRYVAWCLVDAILKQSVVLSLRQDLLKALPDLLNHELPVGSGSGRTTPADGTYLLAYLTILRSWTEQLVIPGDLLPMVETYLKAAVDVQSSSTNGVKDGNGGRKSIVTGGASSVLKGDAGRIASIMGDMMKGGQQGNAAKTEESNGKPSLPHQQQLTGAAMVAKFVAGLYDPSRTRTCCFHCGAYFSTEAARSTHQALHFTDDENTAGIRLYYPSATQFTQHISSHKETGKAVQCILSANEAEKQKFRPLVGTSAGLSSSAGDTTRGKRGRDGDVVQVRDLAQSYVCSICHQKIQPSLDANQNWVLEGCVQTTGGDIAHKGCL